MAEVRLPHETVQASVAKRTAAGSLDLQASAAKRKQRRYVDEEPPKKPTEGESA